MPNPNPLSPSLSTLLLLGVSLCAAPSVSPSVPQDAEPAAPAKSALAHAFFVAGPSFTGIIDEQGETRWSAPRAGARDGWVLPDGHILIAWSDEALEFDWDKQVVWRYRIQAPNQELGTVQRLENGNTLVTELGTAPRLREVTAEGEIAVEFALQPETDNAHMQTRMARKLPGGDYLVPHLLAFAVKRYRPDSTVVETLPTDLPSLGGREVDNWPFTAIRLADGRTLVGCTHGDKVVELDARGEVVWRLDNDDVGGILHDACGVQRLSNGNTVIASYAAQEGVKLFEVDRQKRVVWTYDGPHRVHHFQLLTTNGEPIPGPPMK